MKINTQGAQVAVLKEENGNIVGVFKASIDAKKDLEDAVSSHFDYEATLVDNKDFYQLWDYDEPYSFHLKDETEEGYYVTLYLTYAPIY